MAIPPFRSRGAHSEPRADLDVERRAEIEKLQRGGPTHHGTGWLRSSVAASSGQAGRSLRDNRDLGITQLLEDAVLASVAQRGEENGVEREPDTHPDQHPSRRIRDQVDVAGWPDQRPRVDHQEVTDHGNGNADPERRQAAQPRRPALAFVVGDAVGAIAAQRSAHPLARALLNLRRGQRELEPDAAPSVAGAEHADAEFDPGQVVAVFGEQVGRGQHEHLLDSIEPEFNGLPIGAAHLTVLASTLVATTDTTMTYRRLPQARVRITVGARPTGGTLRPWRSALVRRAGPVAPCRGLEPTSAAGTA